MKANLLIDKLLELLILFGFFICCSSAGTCLMWQSCPSSPEPAGTALKAGSRCLPWAKHWNQSPRATLTSKLCLGIWQEGSASEMMVPCRIHTRRAFCPQMNPNSNLVNSISEKTELLSWYWCWHSNRGKFRWVKPQLLYFSILLPKLKCFPGEPCLAFTTLNVKKISLSMDLLDKPKISGIPARLCSHPSFSSFLLPEHHPVLSHPAHLHWAHQGLSSSSSSSSN